MLFICFIIPSGCSTIKTPNISESEYFRTTGGGFIVSSKLKEIYYSFALFPVTPLPLGSYIEIHYQNPDGGSPIVEGLVIDKPADELSFKSPPVTGVRAYKNYKIEVLLYETQKKEILLGEHTQYIQSLINEKDLNW